MNGEIEDLRHPKLGTPSMRYVYHDTAGQPVLAACRFEQSQGRKTFRPFDLQTRAWKAPDQRPVYNLAGVLGTGPDRTIILVEGEKSADALIGLGYVATTTFGGAKAAHKADLSALTGRSVIIWPDHDEPGATYAAKLADLLRKAGNADVRIVQINDATLRNITLRRNSVPDTYPKSWDAADAVAEGWAVGEINALLSTAATNGISEPPNKTPANDPCARFDLWHAPDSREFATITRQGHDEHLSIEGKTFRYFLAHQHFETEGKPASANALDDRRRALGSQALFAGPKRPVFTRLGWLDGALYLDLCDAAWRAVKITPTGWGVVGNPDAKLIRASSMRALPEPIPGTGNIDQLRQFLNVANDDDFRMLIAWLIGCLQPVGPYPVLILTGEQGSAKSTAAKVLRNLIDPTRPATRSLPRSEQDLVIAAGHSHILAFDNLSTIKPGMADALCRLATGGGFGTRQLYSDTDEAVFDGSRPIILNGITDLATRPDLAERSIIVTLPRIAETERKYESELLEAFDAAAPSILAGLLDAVVSALRCKDSVTLETRPRMADFARWITAGEPALGWPDGAFMASYAANRQNTQDAAIDDNPIADGILLLMQELNHWRGTMTELIRVLQRRFPHIAEDREGFPRQANAFSGGLRRVIPLLRTRGVSISYEREGRERRRIIDLKACK